MKKGEVVISIGSDFGYLDLVQVVSDNVARLVGFDEESLYWIGLALRESVTNAIQHGNKLDHNKRVGIRFRIRPDRLIILVSDQGQGVREEEIPDPLDPQNILKPGGRGIFFVRSFMDNVSFNTLPDGGMELRMEKRLNHKKQGEENDD